MKLADLIDYLANPETLGELYREGKLNVDDDEVLIYMKDKLSLDSEIRFFYSEETEDELEYKKDGVKYVHLLSIDHAVDLIESDLDLKGKGLSNQQIAQRLIDYAINDA